jgi:hypothetical protein
MYSLLNGSTGSFLSSSRLPQSRHTQFAEQIRFPVIHVKLGVSVLIDLPLRVAGINQRLTVGLNLAA